MLTHFASTVKDVALQCCYGRIHLFPTPDGAQNGAQGLVHGDLLHLGVFTSLEDLKKCGVYCSAVSVLFWRYPCVWPRRPWARFSARFAIRAGCRLLARPSW